VPTSPQKGAPRIFYYRVTGWSVGASNFAHSSLQSLFTRKSDEFVN